MATRGYTATKDQPSNPVPIADLPSLAGRSLIEPLLGDGKKPAGVGLLPPSSPNRVSSGPEPLGP